jgi:hypothetical protein
VYKEVEVHTFAPLNIVTIVGTLMETLNTGRSLNCVDQANHDGKGPAMQSRYYFDLGMIRFQGEELKNDGTFRNTYESIYEPGVVLYNFYADVGPTRAYYPGDPVYEYFASSTTSRRIDGYTCNEAALDPLLFQPPV